MNEAANAEPAPNDAGFNDIRPIVPTGSSSNWGLYGFLALLVIGGMVLFNALNASREAAQLPSAIAPQGDGRLAITSPAPLQVPDRFAGREASVRVRDDVTPASQTDTRSIPSPAPPVPVQQVQPPTSLPPAPVPNPAIEPAPRPEVVFERRTPPQIAPRAEEDPRNRNRVKADRFLNPARTIPQGTVIPAVLETAIDSTRPGGVRALVQRDVLGFDGSRVLIPRGSRLYGEYAEGLQQGQNRALVQWTRLIRPDGVTVALDSPSSDPLGRAGIRGKVDSKFLQRFGGALLQSVLDLGVGLAINEATDGVIVALPGSTQNVQVTDQQSIQPTLKVKHGTSVSVFVARDLDFSSVEP